MRSLIFLIAGIGIVLSGPASVNAQSTGHDGKTGSSGQGYVFFAPGALVVNGSSLGMAHIGGGGEAVLKNGIGIGAEAGYVGAWKGFSHGVTLISFNGSYHFNRNRQMSPFVTGGYTLGIASGELGNLFNIGGGLHYWFRERMGIRLEFRDHIDGFGDQCMEGRIGFAFR
jgi:hypothetical protein